MTATASYNGGSATVLLTLEPVAVLSVVEAHAGAFTQGQAGPTYTVTVMNTGAGPTSGTVTLTDTVPSGMTLVSMSGTGWTCPGTAANNCTRSDPLNGAVSFPPLTVTVNVALNAATPLSNSVTVSGGGSASNSYSDSTVIIAQSPQTITFGALSNRAFGTSPFTVSATASSGLTVSFNSQTTPVCTVSGTTVTLVAVGTCTIQATQAGNTNYAAATPVNRSFQVTPGSQTPQSIAFGALSNKPLGTAPFTVSATASSGLAVSFNSQTTPVCTVSGATLTLVSGGTCTIQATQAGNANYAAATPVNQSFLVTQSSTIGGGFSNGVSGFQPPMGTVTHGASTPKQIQYADVNGDGKADAIYFDTLRSNGVWVALSNGRAGFSAPTMWASLPAPSTPDQIQFADVNGDGKADLLYFDTGRSNQVLVGLSNGVNGFSTPTSWLQHGASTPNQMKYADVNGDGKADALYFDTSRSNGVWVALSTGSGFTAPTMWLQHGASTPDQMQYADVNGDGKADALYFDTSRSNGVWVALSTGSGFTAPTMWLQHGASTPSQIQYRDVNGDGKADALYFDTFRSNGVWVALSNGTTAFGAPTPWYQAGPSTPDQAQYADVDGDHKADLLHFDTNK